MKNSVILVPGAWMGAWVWELLKEKLVALGHDIHCLTLLGLGEKVIPREVSLDTHVSNVVEYLKKNQLTESILVGHSYSGFVVGTVAASYPKLVCYSIYIEAFLPTDGRSLLESTGLDVEHEKDLISSNDGKWPHPTREELGEQAGLTHDHIDWLLLNFRDHPGRTITDKAKIPDREIRGAFIGGSAPDLLKGSAPRYDLTFRDLNEGHWPMVTAAGNLSKIMHELIKNDAQPDGGGND